MKYIVQHPIHGDDFQKLSTISDHSRQLQMPLLQSIEDSPVSTFKRAEREEDSNSYQELSDDVDSIDTVSQISKPKSDGSYQRLSNGTKIATNTGKGVVAPSRPNQGDTFQHLSTYEKFEEVYRII